jgi:hypothetical protein
MDRPVEAATTFFENTVLPAVLKEEGSLANILAMARSRSKF